MEARSLEMDSRERDRDVETECKKKEEGGRERLEKRLLFENMESEMHVRRKKSILGRERVLSREEKTQRER